MTLDKKGNFVVKQPKSEDECYEEDNLKENTHSKKKYSPKKRTLDDKKRRKAKRALKRSFED
tara:strand:- start:111459 stop:111644 length:186 start_codon:yes stop_codon:yes gene_type:complete